jgi:hypothetical protein
MTKKLGRGFVPKVGRRKIAVDLNEELFANLQAMAVKEGRSMSRQLEFVLQCGYTCLSESDALELETTEGRI